MSSQHHRHSPITVLRLTAHMERTLRNYTEAELDAAGIDMTSHADTNPAIRKQLAELPPHIRNARLGTLILQDYFSGEITAGTDQPSNSAPAPNIEPWQVPIVPEQPVATEVMDGLETVRATGTPIEAMALEVPFDTASASHNTAQLA